MSVTFDPMFVESLSQKYVQKKVHPCRAIALAQRLGGAKGSDVCLVGSFCMARY